MNLIQKIKCKFGHHVYKPGQMTAEDMMIDGKPSYLFTTRCSCCGRVRRDILFKDTFKTIDDIEDMG